MRSQVPWSSADVEMVFAQTPRADENVDIWASQGKVGDLSNDERKMTVQEWIYVNATKAEEELKREGERIVGVFESEGQRAMGVLEGIECV